MITLSLPLIAPSARRALIMPGSAGPRWVLEAPSYGNSLTAKPTMISDIEGAAAAAAAAASWAAECRLGTACATGQYNSRPNLNTRGFHCMRHASPSSSSDFCGSVCYQHNSPQCKYAANCVQHISGKRARSSQFCRNPFAARRVDDDGVFYHTPYGSPKAASPEA